MHRLWAGSVGILLGCGLAAALAGDAPWQPAPAAPAARIGVTLGRPVAPVADSVSLGTPGADSSIVPVAFTETSPLSTVVVRAQMSDEGSSFATAGRSAPALPLQGAPAAPTAFAAPTSIQTFVQAPQPADDRIVPTPSQSFATAPGLSSAAECCAGDCCDAAAPAGARGGRLYGSAEYLAWWVKDGSTPVLLTTSPPSTPLGMQGVLGSPTTSVVFGGPFDYGLMSGARFTLGYWLDPCETCAVEGSFFFLGEKSDRVVAGSPAFAVVARPFFNENTGTQAAELAVTPGIGSGEVRVSSSSQLLGAAADLRENVCCGCWGHLDIFGGFRYLDLQESINIAEQLTALAGSLAVSPIVPGSQVFAYDSFQTHNQFYGEQIGADLELNRGHWFLDLKGSVSMGDVEEAIYVNGSQTVIPPGGAPTHFVGGLLALPSNIGSYHSDRFGVVPELGLKVGYQFTDNCRIFVGYDALYWNQVVRPGGQIDPVLDVSQIPNVKGPIPPVTPVQPTVPFKQTDYWAQGVSFGLELRY